MNKLLYVSSVIFYLFRILYTGSAVYAFLKKGYIWSIACLIISLFTLLLAYKLEKLSRD
jgi:hypothetical protein